MIAMGPSHLAHNHKMRDTESNTVRHYDDGAGWPNYSHAKEQAFRRGFVAEARRVVREWVDPDDDTFDPCGEEEAARQMRLRVRERYTVYAPGYGPRCAGRKTYHLGYCPGHSVPAARLRGRHHALVYVSQSWDEVTDLDRFDHLILPAWLAAVEQWAETPIRPRLITPPPRPLEIAAAQTLLAEFGKIGSWDDSSSQTSSLTESASEPPSSLKTVISEPPRRLQLTRADQIEMRPPDWLLRGMLERDTFALVFGDPGCGKSFLAIDWACRIATGTHWRGHAVQRGTVVYVAGEGRQGFGRRIRAWQEHHGVNMANAPLFVAPAVAIPQPGELAELLGAIDEGDRPSLIVLDTLARCFGGGDENATQDMSKFVSACDVIRGRYGCTVLVVHHTGHADKSRARGAMALKAALDAEYRLSNDVGLMLTATKMKDAETPPPLSMELVTVELPGVVDDYGNPVTSAAIEMLDADTSAIVAKANAAMSGKRGKWQEVGLSVAQRLAATNEDGRVTVDAWRDACKAVGMIRQNQHRVLDALAKRGDLIVTGNVLSLPTL